jgi:glutamate/tyrosine decarboxylase-like PLP-dependent enzyme
VLPYAARTDHPGYLAFIPSFTTWPAALAELTAAAANPYCGAWMESAGATQVELEVIDWFRGWVGLPDSTAGVLVNGGSAANMTALLVAREAAGGPSPGSVLYVSDQAHSSLARTARAMGLRPETVAAAVKADRQAGRVPFALCASAGSTNTGAVDPLGGLADVCAAEGLWLHVDAAYGGFAALTAKGRAALDGIDRADSVTLDPHKWLYQPMECGCVLIRDGARLERTFAIHPDYLDGDAVQGTDEVNFADRGLQLSRGFRALKVWVAVQTFGLAAFRACIQRNLELAEYALAGRYDVFIDARLIRTLGPGDHFGELAARDWGGGYGYARLATVRCAEPGRLLRLTSEDLQWLADTQPAVKARLEATLAERLQNR